MVAKTFLLRYKDILTNLHIHGSINFNTFSSFEPSWGLIEDPKNAPIHKFIKDSNFDLVLGDPLEVASSLIAWKYDLPLAHNARWTLNGDAGQSKG